MFDVIDVSGGMGVADERVFCKFCKEIQDNEMRTGINVALNTVPT